MRSPIRETKRVNKAHSGPCDEEQWGGDERFTICRQCGQQRFYAKGYRAEMLKRAAPSRQ